MNVPGKAGDDLLLVSAEACMLLDGQDLTPRWTFGTTQVLRYGVLLQGAGPPSLSPCGDLGTTPLPVTWCHPAGGLRPPLVTAAPSCWHAPTPGTCSQRPCMSPLSALLPENPSSATTNPTPQLCLLRTGLAPTDRSAAPPPASALLAAGSGTRAPQAPPRAATCPPPPTGAAPGPWLRGPPVEPGPSGPPWGPAVRQSSHRRPPLRLFLLGCPQDDWLQPDGRVLGPG